MVSIESKYKRTLAAIVASKLKGRLRMRGVSTCWHCNIDIYPFQLECVYKAVGMDPVRLLYCDEPGLGKTIEAGLTLKEMYETGRIDNALIVCPSNLKRQWCSELRHKIKIETSIIDTSWEKDVRDGFSGIYIVGLEYLRSNPYLFEGLSWDMVVFDEAHHLAWRSEKQKRTKSYLIAKELLDNTKNALLLTATPIQLDYFDFWSLLNLLRPDRFPDFNTFIMYKDTYLPFIQRMKRDFDRGKDVSGDLNFIEDNLNLRMNWKKASDKSIEQRLESLFLLENIVIRHRKRKEIRNMVERKAITIPVKYTPQELELYEDISEYIRSLKRLESEKSNHGFGLLAILLKQLLTSSPKALLSTIRNRTSNILEMMDNTEDDELISAEDDSPIDAVLIEEELNKMEDYAQRLEELHHDSKCEKMVKVVSKILIEDPDEKIIMFTRFLETQRHLQDILSKQFRVITFNGQMNERDKDLVINHFKEKDIQVLISTEAGGEGRNLQFAHIVINYDLPWNPVRLEQRIGRIDRLGQTREVSIINMATWDTVEQTIFDRLCERLGMWEDTIGLYDSALGDVTTEIAGLMIDGSTDVDLVDRLLDERIEMAKKASLSFEALKVFKKDDTLRENIDKDLKLKISNEEYMRFLKLYETINGNPKIIAEDDNAVTLLIETRPGEKRVVKIELEKLNPEEGLISNLMNDMMPKLKMLSKITDNTRIKEAIVSLIDESDGSCYLTRNNGEDWFTIDDFAEVEDARDCGLSNNEEEELNRIGEQACVFINKMTGFKKGPFRPEVIMVRNWS